MTDRTKELLIKISIVVAAIFGLLFIPTIPIVGSILGKEYEEWETIWIASFILFVVSGIVMMVFMAVFKFKQKPVKADKFPLSFDGFETLSSFLEKAVTQNDYQMQPTLFMNEQETVTIFVRPNKLWKLDCIALVRTKELTDDILDMANNKITESLKAYYGTERITDTVSMISIICVDRITPTFQKLVNSNIQQGFKNLRLPVGISFGGKSIYIAKQKDGFAITKYKKLRKEFFKIFQIQTNRK